MFDCHPPEIAMLVGITYVVNVLNYSKTFSQITKGQLRTAIGKDVLARNTNIAKPVKKSVNLFGNGNGNGDGLSNAFPTCIFKRA